MTAAIAAACNASPADANQPASAQHVWQTYTNVRFHYAICYPSDLLTPQGESPNSDGQRFIAGDGTQLLVYGQNNALGQTLAQLLTDTAARLRGNLGRVTYRRLKPAWFVVSGENPAAIFYARTLASDDIFQSFELTYPHTAAAIYDPLIGHIAACFRNLAH